jgi:hypothetical protein
MSYDLMVFDPASAPRSRSGFLEWYERGQNGDDAAAPSDDPNSLTPPLRAWFLEMVETFPPMNNFYLKTADVDDPKSTDYALARVWIYACFGWSEAKAAYAHVKAMAERHAVGLFDISADAGDVWAPDGRGRLQRVPE